MIVGAGPLATRKAALLLEAGARVRLRAPEYSDAAERLLREQPESICRDPGVYDTNCLKRAAIVIAATNDAAVNCRVSDDCIARSIPVNVVDQQELGSFLLPAIIERGPLTIAIGSGGRSPVLVRLLRAKIESLIPAGYGRLSELAGRLRDQVQAQFDHVNARRAFWEKAFSGPATELALAGRLDAAAARLQQELANATTTSTPGEVYLIGAGPGDPDLLTFRALRLLQQADVVVHDRLVSSEVVNLARREVERFHVGKKRDQHCVPQEEISALLVRLARAGKRVARLKGGDPFLFGRGGEELDVLMRNGIACQVVPGITAAGGCAAFAGIPLTHRDHAQSVRFITGHTREGRLDVDWSQLMNTRETLVFYMARKGLAEICRGLKSAGRIGSTPAAIIENGTTPQQRVLTGTLDTLAAQAERARIGTPCLIVIGDVVTCHQRLAWFRPDADAAATFPQPMPEPQPSVIESNDHPTAACAS